MKLEWNNIEDQIGGWSKYLLPLFESEEMYNLYQEFKQCKETITPASKDLYKFLKVCKPDKLRVIMILLDSYPGRYRTGTKELQATGIPMDCTNSPDDKLQPSLEAFYEGIEAEYEEKVFHSKDLTYLCEQGVFLGNRALNCKLNKTGSFLGKWDFFWKYFFEEVITPYFPSVPVVLVGKEAQLLKKYVFEMSNPLYMVEHPSAAARAYRTWDTKGVFKTINKTLELNNGPEYKIIWDYKLYKDSLECPF